MTIQDTIAAEWAGIIQAVEAGVFPTDDRPDVDTASLLSKFPHLAGVTVEDIDVVGPSGNVPTRFYKAVGTSRAGLVWVHGGAFLFGTLDQPEANWVSLEWAARGISVLSVDYRKALRDVKYDAPNDDVLAAWRWARANLNEFGVSANNLHLGGASAGGALSASVGLSLRNEVDMLPASLVLVYPMLHSVLPQASDQLVEVLTAAGNNMAEDAERVRQLALHYVGKESLMGDPVAFAGMADDISALPPVYILNADRDPLRASGEKFAEQLADAKVDVTAAFVPNSPHAFLDNPYSNEGHAGVELIADWIERHRMIG